MRRPKPQGTCPTGKLRYRDRIAAQLALGRTDSVTRERAEQRAYRCPQCHGWHLTSRPGKPRP